MACAQPPPVGRQNVVVLEMSPSRSNIRLARLVASGLGSALGLTVEEIDDLRIAVDEACYWVVSNDVVGVVRVRFDAVDEQLAICLTADLRGESPPLSETAHQLLDAVTGHWSLHRDGVALELRLSTRRDGVTPP
jgi:serine/threonine-protein kinase RsbW